MLCTHTCTHTRWKEQESYIDSLLSKLKSSSASEVAKLKDSESKLHLQVEELKRRENALNTQLATKQQEMEHLMVNSPHHLCIVCSSWPLWISFGCKISPFFLCTHICTCIHACIMTIPPTTVTSYIFSRALNFKQPMCTSETTLILIYQSLNFTT